jgi:glycosyltransferase involved in cell wall biosynthesis
MKIAFCCVGINENTLRRTEFYRQDFEILQALGHEVTFVGSPAGLRTSYDLAFVWWWNYLWAWAPVAKALRIPILTTGVFDLEAYRRMPVLKQKLKLWGSRLSDLNVVISKDEELTLPKTFGKDFARIFYSPLAIDSSRYIPPPVRTKSPKETTILNIAWQRLPNIRRKMIPELLEAFSNLLKERKQCRLILAGPPEDGGPYLQSRARELGIADHVEFPGEITRERKIELLQSCSVYCQVSRYEGFGVAIGEALACGAPAVVSPVGAVPEVVGDCGTYVEEQSVQGILNGLRRCLADYEGSLGKAERGVARVRELFSVKRRREDLAGFISRLV